LQYSRPLNIFLGNHIHAPSRSYTPIMGGTMEIRYFKISIENMELFITTLFPTPLNKMVLLKGIIKPSKRCLIARFDARTWHLLSQLKLLILPIIFKIGSHNDVHI